MKKSKRTIVTLIVALTMLAVSIAFLGCGPEGDGDDKTDVAGIYTITFSTLDISGNVRHTGYVVTKKAMEKNTLELKADGTYSYTKLLTDDASLIAGADSTGTVAQSAATVADAGDTVKELFAWEPANEGDNKGTCTLKFYEDGAYSFNYPSYSVTEKGTWVWKSWKMKLVQSNGTEITIPMDTTSREFKFTYIAERSSQLKQTFACASSVWGVALGSSGSYTPTTSGEETDAVSYYFTGSATRKTADGNDYEVTLHMFLLSNGKVYVAEKADASTSAKTGTWADGDGSIKVTVADKVATVADDKIAWSDFNATKSDTIPSQYENADWDKLISDANKPVDTGKITLKYVFTGKYTADGTTVTLNSAEKCVWSEDWSGFVSQGFTSVSGTEKDVVYSKGPTGYCFLPLDHFSSNFLWAPTIKDGIIPDVSYNYAVKVIVNKETGLLEYSTESNLD